MPPPHAQSVWGSREEKVRAAGLAVCCDYLSKKKKKNLPLKICLVGVKSGKKMVGVAVWLGGEGGEKISGARCFLSKPTKNQSPQIEEIIREKTISRLFIAFGHIYPNRHVSNFWTF